MFQNQRIVSLPQKCSGIFVFFSILTFGFFFFGQTQSLAAETKSFAYSPAIQNYNVGLNYFLTEDNSEQQNNLIKAEYYFARAAVAQNSPNLAWYQLSRINFVQGELDTAEANLIKQYEQNGSLVPNVHYMFGLVYGYQGGKNGNQELLAKAEAQFEQFLLYVPDSVWGWTDLAWINFLQGDYVKMKAAAKSGLQYDANHPWLVNNLGIAHRQLGEDVEAKKAFAKAETLAKNMSPETWNRAYMENSSQGRKTGLKEFKAMLAYNSSLYEEEKKASPSLEVFSLVAPYGTEAGYAIHACGHSNPNPPTVTLESNINNTSTWYNDSRILIAPDDNLTLRWSSSNADSCSANFAGTIGTSGSADVNHNLDIGESKVYSVTCSNSNGDTTEEVVVEVPGLNVIGFAFSPKIVRMGDTSTLSWDLKLTEPLTYNITNSPDTDLSPYSYNCTITGATPSGSTYTFDVANGDGVGSFVTSPLSNKFKNVLQCGSAVYAETVIEVVPGIQEL